MAEHDEMSSSACSADRRERRRSNSSRSDRLIYATCIRRFQKTSGKYANCTLRALGCHPLRWPLIPAGAACNKNPCPLGVVAAPLITSARKPVRSSLRLGATSLGPWRGSGEGAIPLRASVGDGVGGWRRCGGSGCRRARCLRRFLPPSVPLLYSSYHKTARQLLKTTAHGLQPKTSRILRK